MVLIISMLAYPAPTMSGAATHTLRAAAMPTSSRQNATPPTNMIGIARRWRRNASVSEPAREPMPMAANRAP